MSEYLNPNLIVETDTLEPGEITWRSPSNLAIVKYWGKHGNQLPRNPSVSLTLESSFTETRLVYHPKKSGERDISVEFFFQGEPNEEFKNKIVRYFESLTGIFPFLRQLKLGIHSSNSFPHSAGIASSASAMSALALCLCSLEHELFETLDDDEEFDRKASYVARLGSGSACRSIYPIAALWGLYGEISGSSDLYAVPLEHIVHEQFRNYQNDILIVSTEAKSVSSRAGHTLMDTHPFAESRYSDARRKLHFLLEAMKKGDLETFGQIAENEALTLHSLMMSSNPAYILFKPNTLELLERIRSYRHQTKQPVFFSLDAGPNIHLLYPREIIHTVRPFVEEELIPFCENGQYLPDWVGDGPVQI